jgi:hypothetical protein
MSCADQAPLSDSSSSRRVSFDSVSLENILASTKRPRKINIDLAFRRPEGTTNEILITTIQRTDTQRAGEQSGTLAN